MSTCQRNNTWCSRAWLAIALLVAVGLTLPSLASKPAGAEGQRLVLAFYYNWFDENTWTPAKVPDFPAQPYVSRDPAVMDRHIAQAQGAGIDAFVVSWYGPGGGNQTEGNFAAMLDVAAARGFKLALDVEVTSPFAGGGTAGTAEMLRHALATHANHPAYLRVDGKPVFFFWRQQRYGVDTWQGIRDQVDPGRGSIWIAEGIDMSYQAVFDGHHLYSVTWNPPSDVAATANKFSRWMQDARNRYGSHRYWVATVMPGYNDTRTGRGNAFARSREDGAYYVRTWQAAIASNPDWVIITSFNEWPEGTYIEPSQTYGDRYLGLTAEWAGRFKRGEGMVYTPPAPAASGPPAAPPTPAPTPTPVPTPSYAAVRVETAVLNLRSAPDTSASLLGQATATSVWRTLAKLPDESWWQVCCVDRQRAWVSGQYVQPVGPAEALQQVPDLDPAATSSEWRGIILD
ncbi:MAG TPA: endo-1,3-alpha-glucanase family glycosylhydrolase [Anaerolineae bacterium]|nr:endo-1,3-alpha-glucanase family glycosylhydrolase [Anaerolineae bacterium]